MILWLCCWGRLDPRRKMMVLHFGLTAFFGTPVVSRRGTLFYLIWHEPLPHPHSLVTQSLHQIKTFDLSFSSPDHVNVRFCSFFLFSSWCLLGCLCCSFSREEMRFLIDMLLPRSGKINLFFQSNQLRACLSSSYLQRLWNRLTIFSCATHPR